MERISMISPLTRCAMAAVAWLLTLTLVLSRDHHAGPLLMMLSIVLALSALVPKGALAALPASRALRTADFLACGYLLALLAWTVVAGLLALLHSGALPG